MIKTFSASLEQLYDMLAFIRNHAFAHGFDEKQIGKIELATEEALVNIISYGYPEKKGEIEINCNIDNSGVIEIVLKDNGVPYNPLTNEKAFKPRPMLESHKVGGYGIYFIRQVMDDVKYSREKDFNVLTMIKKK